MPELNFDSTELPAIRAYSHCVLIPRDPHFIYAYWDYTPQDIDRARRTLGVKSEDSQLVLRVYDITHVDFDGSNANHTWDLDVGFAKKNWYVHVGQDNANYCAQLGISCGENRFFPLSLSNIARTPPKSASKRSDLIWQDIKVLKESRPYGFIQQLSKKKTGKGKQLKKTRIYYLTAEDIRAYYMDLFARVSRRGRKKVRSIEDILKRKLKGMAWQKVRLLLRYPDLIGRTHPGASLGLLKNKGASETLSSPQVGAKGAVGGPGASEGRLNKRKFFFEIWSELIVYGRTEPDAKLWLNQKGIKLNPDGTFSLRYALPDGEVPLKFIAQSSDDIEQRCIDTRVEREKTIGSQKILKDFHA